MASKKVFWLWKKFWQPKKFLALEKVFWQPKSFYKARTARNFLTARIRNGKISGSNFNLPGN
jgi:hypothetical protein